MASEPESIVEYKRGRSLLVEKVHEGVEGHPVSQVQLVELEAVDMFARCRD